MFLKMSKSNLKCTLPALAQKQIKVLCIICIKFWTSSRLFSTYWQFTSRL